MRPQIRIGFRNGVEMRTVGLSEARQKLSHLVDRAEQGERIGIARRGKLVAFIVSERPARSLAQIFDGIERIRKSAKGHSASTKDFIEHGRS
jgi:prevent-host-death family protein